MALRSRWRRLHTRTPTSRLSRRHSTSALYCAHCAISTRFYCSPSPSLSAHSSLDFRHRRCHFNISITVSKIQPVWARGRCRISPPRFLAECCKRQLNQGSFLLYFRLFTFSDLYLVYLYFPVLFCLSVTQYQSSDWL